LYEWLGSYESSEYLRSVHDLSDGGLLVAVAESCFVNNLGVNFDSRFDLQNVQQVFGEGFHQFIVTVPERQFTDVEALWTQRKLRFVPVGVVTEVPELSWKAERVSVADLYQSWSRESL